MAPMPKEEKIAMREIILLCVAQNFPMLGILMDYVDKPRES